MTTEAPTQEETLASLGSYQFGWHDTDVAGASAQRGLSEAVVRDISAKKDEPDWMLALRLKALAMFDKKPMPNWGSDLSTASTSTTSSTSCGPARSRPRPGTTCPPTSSNTYDRLGIPEAEKQRLVSGVAAQYESEVVYHSDP